MATSKTRINISVSKATRDALKHLAKRDQEPVATKAADLLELALEIEEDRILSEIAEKREKADKGKYISHAEAWGHVSK